MSSQQKYYCVAFDKEDGAPANFCKIRAEIVDLPYFDVKHVPMMSSHIEDLLIGGKVIYVKRSGWWQSLTDLDSARDFNGVYRKISEFTDISDSVLEALIHIWTLVIFNKRKEIDELKRFLKKYKEGR